MKIMEQTMNQNLHILANKLTNVQSVKMITQLLLSLSVFSFIFSKPSLISFLNSLNFCLSTFPYQLFTHTIDKNFMFLVCNGLLVFLAKYSGFIRLLSLSSSFQEEISDHDSESTTTVDVSQSNGQTLPRNEETMVLVVDKEVCVDSEIVIDGLPQDMVDIEDHEEENIEKEFFTSNQGDQEVEKAVIFEEKESEEEEESALEHVEEDIYDDEEEEELGNAKLSTEELNKKFDDFIRRMKEDLRIEAQGHLIMV